jgi:hypothetical protein
VLALLREEDAQIWWMYLHWVVEEQGTQDSRLHTELAVALAQAALDKMAQTERNGAETEAEQAGGKRNGTLDTVSEDRLAEGVREGLTEDSGASTSEGNRDERFGYSDWGGGESQGSKSRQEADRDFEPLSGNAREDGAGGAKTSVQKGVPGKSKPSKPSGNSAGTVSDVRRQLQAFLDESENYDIAGVLEKIKGSELWREQVRCNSLSSLRNCLALLVSETPGLS